LARILILSSSFLERDPRILRQIYALKDNHDLTTCGMTPSNISGVKEYPLLFRPSRNQNLTTRVKNFLKMILGNYDNLTWNSSVREALDAEEYDIIIVNDPREMPLAISLKSGKSKAAKIYFDLHEWFIDLDDNEVLNKMFCSLTDQYYKAADVYSTVSMPIAQAYAKRYKSKLPYLILNARPYADMEIIQPQDGKIKMVHHGVLNRMRKLEEMVKMFDFLDERFELTFYLRGTDESYKNELYELSKGNSRIKILPSISFDKVLSTINKFDIGVYIMHAPNQNHEWALPNKLFEFIQARLAIAITPNVAMKQLVEKHNIGVVSKDFTAKSMAEELNKLTKEDIIRFKENSNKAAKVENDEVGIETIQSIIKDLDE